LRGYYFAGFERSLFRPCHLPDVVFWTIPHATAPNALEPARELIRQKPDAYTGLTPEATVYVELDAELDAAGENGGPKGYGHLGQYTRQMRVLRIHRVLEAAQAPASCDRIR
jgi:hypothetical protein